MVNCKIFDVTDQKQIITIDILPNTSRNEGNQAIKLGQLIKFQIFQNAVQLKDTVYISYKTVNGIFFLILLPLSFISLILYTSKYQFVFLIFVYISCPFPPSQLKFLSQWSFWKLKTGITCIISLTYHPFFHLLLLMSFSKKLYCLQ